MSFRSTIISILLCTSIIACEEVPEQGVSATVNVEENMENPPVRQLVQSNNPEELSCLKQCGAEARGTVYGDCIAAGEDQQECAVNGREWYRECLAERCGEAALQQDDVSFARQMSTNVLPKIMGIMLLACACVRVRLCVYRSDSVPSP